MKNKGEETASIYVRELATCNRKGRGTQLRNKYMPGRLIVFSS